MATLFAVEFENNNLIDPVDGFYSVRCAGGTIEVSAASALTGSYGLAVTPIAGYDLYGLQKTGTRLTRIRQRFQFDPNGVVMDAGGYLDIASNGYTSDHRGYKIAYRNNGGVYGLRMAVWRDDYSPAWTSNYAIADAPCRIEFDWKASSAPGANDGFMSLWIDGTFKETLAAVDNDTFAIGYPALGLVSVPPTGYAGTYFLDHWQANDDGSLIGA